MQHFESGKNMVQTKDGNVHLIGYGVTIRGDYYYNDDTNTCQQYRLDYGKNFTLLYTTNPSLTGVKKLPRDMFVREVDRAKRDKAAEIIKDAVLKLSPLCKHSEYIDLEKLVSILDDSFFFLCVEQKNISLSKFDSTPKLLKETKLSLPQSLTIEDNDKVTNLKWK